MFTFWPYCSSFTISPFVNLRTINYILINFSAKIILNHIISIDIIVTINSTTGFIDLFYNDQGQEFDEI